jgi:hypothetical protein
VTTRLRLSTLSQSTVPRSRAPARHAHARRPRTRALCAAMLCAAHLCADATARKPRHPRAASAPSTAQILAPSAATVPADKTIYRCGNTYSVHACSDTKPLDVTDARSDAQRRQADDVTARDKRLASWYAAGRHERETIASAPATNRRTAAAPQCVSNTTMTCVPKRPRSRVEISTAASATVPTKPR